MIEMLRSFWSVWALYYLFGYIGIVLHVYLKVPATQSVLAFVKKNSRDLFISILCYNVAIFIWWDTGLEIMGYIKNTPNGQTFVLAYFAQSIITSILKKRQGNIVEAGGVVKQDEKVVTDGGQQ